MTESLDGTELTCRQIIDFVRAYLDGELPARERTIFDLHLAICPDCVHYLESYRTMLALEKQHEPLTSPVIPEDLVKAILAARQK